MKKFLSAIVFFFTFAVYVIFRTPTYAAPLGAATVIPPAPVVVSDALPVPMPSTTTASSAPPVPKKSTATTTHTTKKTTATVSHHMHVKVVHRGPYVDGTYTGRRIDSYYETVQVRIVVKNGTLTKVSSLPYQIYNGTSQAIAGYAIPILRSEALLVQSAHVNTISGATEVSNAFRSSLNSAVLQAA